jgi:ABC-type glycerol-3-phosphate transport system substrate-binding protein
VASDTSDPKDTASDSAKLSRRDVLKAGVAGAAGIAAAATLGKTGVAKAAAPAIVTRAPQTITLQSWFQFEPGRNTAWFTMIKKFHASQNDYRIQWTGWPSASYTTHVLVQQASGGIPADVITLIPDLAYRLVLAGVLEPVEDIVAKFTINGKPAVLTDAHSYLRRNGHLYGVNVVEVPFAVIYNKQLTDKAGIAKPATNLADWRTQLHELTHKPTQYGFYMPNAPQDEFGWWFFLQNYCLMYDTLWAVGKKAMVNSPKIVAALEYWLEQYKNTMAAGLLAINFPQAFGAGLVAETMFVSAGVNEFKTVAPAVFPHIRSFPPPWPSRKAMSRLHPMSIVAGTPKMDGAKAFAEFLYDPVNNAELMELCLDVVPTYTETLALPGVKPWLDAQAWAQGYQEIVHFPFVECEGDFIAHDTEFGNIVTQNFEQAIFGNTTVQAAMDSAQQQIEDASNRWFKS